jgi:hypothetical protein
MTVTNDDLLKGWKEISSFLRVAVRTARRWKEAHGLPVRQVKGDRGSSILASRKELRAWLETRGAINRADPPGGITVPMLSRPTRLPDAQHEIEVLRSLVREVLTQHASRIHRSLVDAAMDLCKPESAGLSLLEQNGDGSKVFRWTAPVGKMRRFEGGTTPADFSPCGYCLNRNTAQLFVHPERYYTYLADIIPMAEALLVPLYGREGSAIGTLWVIAHSGPRTFDRDDVRILTTLVEFARLGL